MKIYDNIFIRKSVINMTDGVKVNCPNCGKEYFVTGNNITFTCVNCSCQISANNQVRQGEDHSLALAIWGIILFWLIPLSMFFTIKALVLGIKRKRIVTIVFACIPIALILASLIYIIFYALNNQVNNVTFE